jgi:hypothetical protein
MPTLADGPSGPYHRNRPSIITFFMSTEGTFFDPFFFHNI